MEETRKTAPLEAIESIIAAGQEARKDILAEVCLPLARLRSQAAADGDRCPIAALVKEKLRCEEYAKFDRSQFSPWRVVCLYALEVLKRSQP